VSLLKAWFGPAATAAHDFGFDRLPRQTGDHSHMVTVAAMTEGKVPPDPVVPTKRVAESWASLGVAALGIAAALAGVVLAAREA
jgi:hypothetical protein